MPTPDSITLRPFGPPDIAAAHGLSRAVSWPHRLEDWRLMAALGEGVVAADRDGTVQGVAMLWRQGADFATLGMVIVSPALQKAGIGRRLLAALVEAAGERRIQLNATAEGLKLYRSFGFAETGGIHQHNGILSPSAVPASGAEAVRPLRAGEAEALRGLDRAATGVDRGEVLSALLAVSEGLAVERDGVLAGTLLVRDFGRGRLLGPLVARDEEAALALLSSAATRTGGFLRADIPEGATRLAAWLAAAGLARVGAVRTMLRGAPAPARDTPRVFGLASQALG